jgi:hypothetical protein
MSQAIHTLSTLLIHFTELTRWYQGTGCKSLESRKWKTTSGQFSQMQVYLLFEKNINMFIHFAQELKDEVILFLNYCPYKTHAPMYKSVNLVILHIHPFTQAPAK